MTDSATMHLLLILAAIALAVLGFILLPTATTVAQDVPPPTAPPDAAAGLAIYSERCEVCHGEMGNGLGVQAVQAGLEPAAFSEPTYRVTAVPAVMFDIINNGNINAGMPPFGSASSAPLDDADIWNLVAVAYSFSTRPDDIAAGEALATELEADTSTWPGVAYWFSRSNEAILAELESEDILGIDLSELTDEEKLSLIDYGRSLNYTYTDPLAAFAPVPLGIINGQVINGTTNEAYSEGEVRLRAFTTQLEEMYTETVPINEDGSFEFQLENVPTDWVFLADVAYGDLTFNSNAVQISNAQPEAQIPLFIFETTTDPAAISIDRLHMIFTFGEERLIVSELYVFSNREAAVFVGKSGDYTQGTVEIGLPTGAENISFQRGFGTSLDSFIPATDFIRTETGWADVNPLQPGAGSLNLLVNYDLPYEDGMMLAHPLAYQLSGGASVIMADAGVQISDENWASQGAQATASGSFVSYINTNLANADAISMTLDGRPTQIFDAQGNALPVRNETNELIVGGVALAAMLAVGFFLVQRWRTAPAGQTSVGPVPVPVAAPPRQASQHAASEKGKLLEAIADLDDAYEAGELGEATYRAQRQDLKSRLTAVWQ
ncbi:c-type cytochrome [Candidatus Leptofilum sp.]|uniref:c-type cytochrome n=1 Tax=Candidatus Leptofilum sp. TaxID=3241576 RepID=UPI003B5BB001